MTHRYDSPLHHLGASWIHGTGTARGKNPMCRLAAAVGAATVATRWAPVDGTSQLTEAEYLAGWERVDAMRDAREEALEAREEEAGGDADADADADQSLWAGLMGLQKAGKGGVDMSTLTPREMEVLMYVQRAANRAKPAARLDSLHQRFQTHLCR